VRRAKCRGGGCGCFFSVVTLSRNVLNTRASELRCLACRNRDSPLSSIVAAHDREIQRCHADRNGRHRVWSMGCWCRSGVGTSERNLRRRAPGRTCKQSDATDCFVLTGTSDTLPARSDHVGWGSHAREGENVLKARGNGMRPGVLNGHRRHNPGRVPKWAEDVMMYGADGERGCTSELAVRDVGIRHWGI
jgi:hypothetical protein